MTPHEHPEINKALGEIKQELGTITGHLTANGGLSIVYGKGRVKFTGSLPVKWLGLGVTLLAGGVGSNLMGWWP